MKANDNGCGWGCKVVVVVGWALKRQQCMCGRPNPDAAHSNIHPHIHIPDRTYTERSKHAWGPLEG